MSSVLDSSGRIVEDSEGVKVVENFHRDLYNIKATDDTLIEWFLSQLEPDSVRDEEEEEKDPELTLEELTQAAKTMNTGSHSALSLITDEKCSGAL
ncbi:UNVERIFIED_CONTAM: hypothetical protein FKN15_017975 [Acipenser sinensis]